MGVSMVGFDANPVSPNQPSEFLCIISQRYLFAKAYPSDEDISHCAEPITHELKNSFNLVLRLLPQ